MAKEILLPHGTRKKIMEILNTSYPTIRYSVRFKCDSPLAKKIRKIALENGGKLVEY